MRPLPILSALCLTVVTPAFAQVTVDLHALQALPDHPESSRPVPPRPARPATAALPAATPSSVATRQAPTAAVPAPQPALPESVPDTAALTVIAPSVPTPGAAVPPPPPVSDKAATTAATTSTGLRLTFAPGQSDLSTESSASIKLLATITPTTDDTTFNVLAYAPGKADDPSTARRVSLSRAMAVRSALVADGVPSARIFVRALGEQYGDGPPDRVDIGVMGANSPSGSGTAR